MTSYLDDLVHAAETVAKIAKKERWNKEDVEILRDAKERYFLSKELLKNYFEAKETSVETKMEIDGRLEDLIRERDALNEALLQKELRLKALLRLSRDLVSVMERWEQWEFPDVVPPPSRSTFPERFSPVLDSDISSMDAD